MTALTVCLLGAFAAPPAQDILVGVNYFAGWWEPLPNKWHGADGEDWRPRYPERVPLLGEYNDQESMDREIAAAAAHGVDFFAILWYYNRPGEENEPNARFLERGVRNFMASPEAHRMKFFVEFCNHPPYEVSSDGDWENCVRFWLDCFRHPSYLRVDGKLVFKVHGGHYFLQQNGGDLDAARAKLDRLRAAVRDAGLGEMLIGCGVGSAEEIAAGHWAAKLFDFTATYMDVPALERGEEDHPYTLLADQAAAGREKHTVDAVPHMPYVPAGWNPRPWPDPRPCFAFPKREEWTECLERVKADLRSHAALGLPGQKAFTIYAWNEFGEGGIVAPTRGDNYMKLDAIRAVFKAPEQ